MGRISVVHLGRLIGAAIIIIGIGLAIWNVADMDYGSTSQKFRLFLYTVIDWVAFGSLVYLGAEILDQLVIRNLDLEPLDEPQELG